MDGQPSRETSQIAKDDRIEFDSDQFCSDSEDMDNFDDVSIDISMPSEENLSKNEAKLTIERSATPIPWKKGHKNIQQKTRVKPKIEPAIQLDNFNDNKKLRSIRKRRVKEIDNQSSIRRNQHESSSISSFQMSALSDRVHYLETRLHQVLCENRTLESIQKRQEKALSKHNTREQQSIVDKFVEEIRVLKELLRRQKMQLLESQRVMRQRNISLGCMKNKDEKDIIEEWQRSKNDYKRKDSTKVAEWKKKLELKEKMVEQLQRQNRLLEKNHNRKLSIEIHKHSETRMRLKEIEEQLQKISFQRGAEFETKSTEIHNGINNNIDGAKKTEYDKKKMSYKLKASHIKPKTPAENLTFRRPTSPNFQRICDSEKIEEYQKLNHDPFSDLKLASMQRKSDGKSVKSDSNPRNSDRKPNLIDELFGPRRGSLGRKNDDFLTDLKDDNLFPELKQKRLSTNTR